MKVTKLLLVEDSAQYCEVLAFGLSEEPGFEIWAQFNTADAALRHLEKQSDRPDIILLDLNLPGVSGIDALPAFKEAAPKTEVIVITASERQGDILDAIASGAVGYLLKESSLTTIIEGIRTVLNGGASLDPGMARFLLEDHRHQPATALTNSLTPRELEILDLIATGLPQKQIAAELNISPKTVDFHIGQTYKKLGVPNAPAAIAKAYESGTLPTTKKP